MVILLLPRYVCCLVRQPAPLMSFRFASFLPFLVRALQFRQHHRVLREVFALEMSRAYAIAQRKAAELEAATGVPAPFLFSTYPLASDPADDSDGQLQQLPVARGPQGPQHQQGLDGGAATADIPPMAFAGALDAAASPSAAAAGAAASPSASALGSGDGGSAGGSASSGSGGGGGSASAVLAGLASLASAAAVVDQGKSRTRARGPPLASDAGSGSEAAGSGGGAAAGHGTGVGALPSAAAAAAATAALSLDCSATNASSSNTLASGLSLGPCDRCREVSALLRLGIGISAVVPAQHHPHLAATGHSLGSSAGAGSAAATLHDELPGEETAALIPERGRVVLQRDTGAAADAAAIDTASSALAASIAAAERAHHRHHDGPLMSHSLTVTTAPPARPAPPDLSLGRPLLLADTPGSLNITAPPSGCSSATAASGVAGSLSLSLGSATAAAVAACAAASGAAVGGGGDGRRAPVPQLLHPAPGSAPGSASAMSMAMDGSAATSPALLALPAPAAAVTLPAAEGLLHAAAVAAEAPASASAGAGTSGAAAGSVHSTWFQMQPPAAGHASAAHAQGAAAQGQGEDFAVEAGQLATLAQTGVLSLLAAAVAGLRNRSNAHTGPSADSDASLRETAGSFNALAPASAAQILQEALSLSLAQAAALRAPPADGLSSASSRAVSYTSTSAAVPTTSSIGGGSSMTGASAPAGGAGFHGAASAATTASAAALALALAPQAHQGAVSASQGAFAVASAGAPASVLSPAAIAQQMLAQMRMHRLMLQRQAVGPVRDTAQQRRAAEQPVAGAGAGTGYGAPSVATATAAGSVPLACVANAPPASASGAITGTIPTHGNGQEQESAPSAFTTRAAAKTFPQSGYHESSSSTPALAAAAVSDAVKPMTVSKIIAGTGVAVSAAARAASWAASVPPLRKPWTRDALEMFSSHLLAIPLPDNVSMAAATGAGKADVFAFLRN